MKHYFIFLIALFVFSASFAQQRNSNTIGFEYYFELSGVNSKAALKTLATNIKQKSQVVNFNSSGNGYVLSTKTSITKEILSSWLTEPVYKVLVFKTAPTTADLIKQKRKLIAPKRTTFDKKN